jgi:hypothetical protein
MEIEEIKIWQWVLAGLVAGALFSCVWAWNGPAFDTQTRDTMLQGEFENDCLALTKLVPPAPGPESRWVEQYHKDQLLLRNITVHPPIASDPKRYWVTAEMYTVGPKPIDPKNPKSQEKITCLWTAVKYPAPIPYAPGYEIRSEKKLDKFASARRNAEVEAEKKAMGGQTSFPTVVEYLKAVQKIPNANLQFHYAFWEKPAYVWTLPPLAGLLMIGIAWPMTLSAMQNFGLAKPAPVKGKAKPQTAPAKKPARPTSSIASPAGGAAAVVQPSAPAALTPGDTRKYGGEFYPVVKAVNKD